MSLDFTSYGECPAFKLSPRNHDFQIVRYTPEQYIPMPVVGHPGVTEYFSVPAQVVIVCKNCFGKDVVDAPDLYPQGERNDRHKLVPQPAR